MTITFPRVCASLLGAAFLLGGCAASDAGPTGGVFVDVRPAAAMDGGEPTLPAGAAVVARQGGHVVAEQPLAGGLAAPPLALAPGRYTIEVTGAGQSCDHIQVTVSASQRVDVTLNCPAS